MNTYFRYLGNHLVQVQGSRSTIAIWLKSLATTAAPLSSSEANTGLQELASELQEPPQLEAAAVVEGARRSLAAAEDAGAVGFGAGFDEVEEDKVAWTRSPCHHASRGDRCVSVGG